MNSHQISSSARAIVKATRPQHCVRRSVAIVVLFLAAILQSGCDATAENDPNATFNISTHITGLAGTLVLHQAGVGSFSVTGEGYVELATRIRDGANYNITIGRQPYGQTCTISNGSGLAGTDMDVVDVMCSALMHPLSVNVSGLDGEVILRNGSDNLSINVDGTYTFAEQLPPNTEYSILIDNQSDNMACTVDNGNGITRNSPIPVIAVNCSEVDPLLVRKITISVTSPKTLRIDWTPRAAAMTYQLLRDADGIPGGNLVRVTKATALLHALDQFASHLRSDAIYAVEACDTERCVISDPVSAQPLSPLVIGKFRPASSEASNFGEYVSLSADGKTMAVTAYYVPVSIYRYINNAWVPWAQILPPGYSAAPEKAVLSPDGNWLAMNYIGADYIPGFQGAVQGKVFLYRKVDGNWVLAQTLSHTTELHTYFGRALSFSGDASLLAVGDFKSSDYQGAVSVYARNGNDWTLQRTLAAPTPSVSKFFGFDLALSADGSTLAIGAPHDFATSTGVNGSQTQTASGYEQVGAVHVFVRNGTDWLPQAYLKPSAVRRAWSRFGWDVAISSNGNTVAIGVPGDDNGRTGLYKPNDLPIANSINGAAYVFGRNGTTWSQDAYIKPRYLEGEPWFGMSVALSANGRTLAVGAPEEGRGPEESGDGYVYGSGAAYLYLKPGSSWKQHRYLKAPLVHEWQAFGTGVALSGNGDTLAISAACDDSAEHGINNSLGSSPTPQNCGGSVFLY